MTRSLPPIPDFILQGTPEEKGIIPVVYPVTRRAWAWMDEHHAGADFLPLDGETIAASEAVLQPMEAAGMWVKTV